MAGKSAPGERIAALSARLSVRLTPSGGADRIDGVARDAAGHWIVKARVRAAPENGEANKALEALLAKAVGAPKSSVSVVRGATARMKQIRFETKSAAELDAFIAALPRTLEEQT